MYCKLALKNVKKSYQDYLIYFLTLAFSVCLFYSFNSFQAQQAVLEANASYNLSTSKTDILTSLNLIMNILSIFVSIILAFLIIYANNFLIKQRKKELAIYTLLGMPKSKISRVFVYETFIIGLLSLFIGLGLGLLLSQVLLVVTANFFEVVLHYQFIYSPQATQLTILAFSIIFIMIILFNTYSLNKHKLIDLIHANHKQEKVKLKNTVISILLFFISLLFLGIAYDLILTYSFIEPMFVMASIISGSLGTVLFFLSLSGFLLRFIQTSKSLYFRKLNMFVLRQINANINSNFLSMSVICIMLLLSIGSLSTGFSLNSIITQSIKLQTPYHYTYMHYTHLDNQQDASLSEKIKKLPIDYDTYIQKQSFLQIYTLENGVQQLLPYIDDNKNFQPTLYPNQSIEIVSLSQFNELRAQYKYSPIQLEDNEAYLFTSKALLKDTIYSILQAKPTLNIYDHKLKITNESFEIINAGNTYHSGTFSIALVVADEYIPEYAKKYFSYWNVVLKEGISSTAFEQYINNIMHSYDKQLSEKITDSQGTSYFYALSSITDTSVKEDFSGLTVTFTYIGLYLGSVFLIASTVILALQQLSQANDNKKRYLILYKIGAEKRMINRSIFLQVAIYFFIPLTLAIIHSFVGIKAVNITTVYLGEGNIFLSSLFTAMIILGIYGSYFLATYFSYKRILKQT